MPIGIGAAILGAGAMSAGGSFLGGLFGSSAAKKARRQQMRLLAQAQGQLDLGLEALPGMQEDYLSEVDEANLLLAGIEPAVLQGFDESQRVRIAQQMRQSQSEREMQQQRLATAGMDTTTVAPSMQRGMALGQAQQAAGIGAQYASARGSAQSAARAAQAQGQMARAQGLQYYDQMEIGLRQNKAQQYYGTQVAPDTTGRDIGSIGAGIADSFLNYALMSQLGGGGSSTPSASITGSNWAAGFETNPMYSAPGMPYGQFYS
jgi:hypothetical protein